MEPTLREAAKRHPVVTITGPRQSGKTTLCRSVFSHLPYFSLEQPATRSFALQDPLGFLEQLSAGAVIDEVQRVPQLTSYLQGMVDADPRPGRFILTGSQHFGLHQAISQSLAGRTAMLYLLPLTLGELMRFDPPAQGVDQLMSVLFGGSYPAIYDRRVPPQQWLSGYVATYVERDVRQILNVGDLLAFQTFVALAAGRTAQLLNLSSLGGDCGVSHNTTKAWLSVLEASFLVQRLPPFYAKIKKRLVKAPKLHFLDSGLLCYLLDIQSPAQLSKHPARGAIFESWVASELTKQRFNRGLRANLSFYRDRSGVEVDLLARDGERWRLIEVKSGQTAATDAFASLERVASLLRERATFEAMELVLVYGGAQRQQRTAGRVLPWRQLAELAPLKRR